MATVTLTPSDATTIAARMLLGAGKYAKDTDIVVSGTGAELAGLTFQNLQRVDLGGRSITLDATDNAVSMTLAQANALSAAASATGGGAKFSTTDLITITGSAAALASADFATLRRGDLGGGKITLDAATADVSLTVAQADALRTAGIKFSGTDLISVTGTGAELAALTFGSYRRGDLGGGRITMNASDNAVSLTVAQANALQAALVKFSSTDVISLTGTGAELAALTFTDYRRGLMGGSRLVLDTTDNAVNLTVTQADALKAAGVKFASSDVVTLTGTGAELAALTFGSYRRGDLGGGKVNMNASDNAVTLTVAQADAMVAAGVKFATTGPGDGDVVTVTGTGAALAALTFGSYARGSLGGGSVILDASDDAASLTATQAAAMKAAGVKFAATDLIAVTGTGAALAALTFADYNAAALGGSNVYLDASDNAASLTSTQAAALKAAGIMFSTTDAISVTGTGAVLSALTFADVNAATLGGASVTLDASDNIASLTTAQAAALAAAGVKFATTDVLTLADTGANLAGLTFANYSTTTLGGASLSLNASDNAASLTVAQVTALVAAGITFAADDVITVTGAPTVAQLNALDAPFAGSIVASVSATAADLVTLTGPHAYTVTVTDTPTVANLNTIDGLTTGVITAAIGGTAAALALLTGTGNAYTATVSDTGVVSAADLVAIDNATTVAVVASLMTGITGTLANDALVAASITTPTNYSVVVTGDATTPSGAADIASLNALDADNGTGTITAAIGGTAAELAVLAGSHTYTTTVSAGEVTAANLNLINTATTVAVGAALVTGFTGTQTEVAAVMDAKAASQITLGTDFGVTVSGTMVGSAAISTLNSVDTANGSGTITATINATAAQLAGLNGAHAYTAQVNDAVVAAADLKLVDAATTVAVDATLCTSITGTAANIKSVITSAGISTGTVVYDVSGNAISFTVAEANALPAGATFAGTDTITITGTGTELAGLTFANYGLIKLGGGATATLLDASDNVVSLTVAQAGALNLSGVDFAANDAITITDTGTALAGLSFGNYAVGTLGGVNVVIDASNNVISMTATQVASMTLNTIKVASSDAITVTGITTEGAVTLSTAGTALNKANLGGSGVTLDAADNGWEETATVFNTALAAGIKIAANDAITVTTIVNQATALTAYTTALMGGSGVTLDSAGAGAWSIAAGTLDTALAAGIKINGGTGGGALVADTVAVTGIATANETAALTTYTTAKVGGGSVTLDAADGTWSMTAVDLNTALTAGIKFDASDAVTATGILTGNEASALTDYARANVGGSTVTLSATDGAWSNTAALFTAAIAAGVKIAASDAVTVTAVAPANDAVAVTLAGVNLESVAVATLTKTLLGGSSVTLDSTDNTWLIENAYLTTVLAGGTKFASSDTITVTDATAFAGGITSAITNFSKTTVGANVVLDSTGNAVSLTGTDTTSLVSLGTKFGVTDVITITTGSAGTLNDIGGVPAAGGLFLGTVGTNGAVTVNLGTSTFTNVTLQGLGAAHNVTLSTAVTAVILQAAKTGADTIAGLNATDVITGTGFVGTLVVAGTTSGELAGIAGVDTAGEWTLAAGVLTYYDGAAVHVLNLTGVSSLTTALGAATFTVA